MKKKAPVQSSRDHWEAVRLSWKSRHIPFGTILISGLALASVLSAVFTIIAEGPANAIR
jgi:hypothetical protein